MTTLTKTPGMCSRHDATFTVTPDDERAAGLAKSFGSRTRFSPYAMTKVRAEKCMALYRAGFSAGPGGTYIHPNTDRLFLLAEAVACAEILERARV